MDSPCSGSGSPASSNSASPVLFNRSDSTVVEKPSHVNYESSESIEFYSLMNGDNSRVEVLVIDESQPSCNSAPQSPGSGYSSNKTTDDEDDNEGELDEGFDELCDEGFAQLLAPDDTSESVMIPTSALLEDFDLGVDMFDSTEQAILSSEPLKSPFGQIPMAPGSPYQLVATSSSPVAIPPQDVQSQNDYNEYLNQTPSNPSSSPSYSQHSGFIPDEDDLAMLLCEDMSGTIVVSDPLPLPISSCGQHTTGCSTVVMDFAPCSVSYSNSTFSSQVDPSFTTPTLTSVHMNHPNLVDLAEASHLVLTGDGVNTGFTIGMPMSHAPVISQTSTAPVGLESTFSAASSVNTSISLSNLTRSVAGTPMCSKSSQTSRMSRSLSPAPSHTHSPSYLHQHHSPSPSPRTDRYSTSSVGSTSAGASYYTPSPDPAYFNYARGSPKDSSSSPSSGKRSPLPDSKDKLVDMPFYQFKKILDNPDIDTDKKEEVKNIRKRGKNKVAAKNCRQKKIEVVLGLQQEVDQMKEDKKRLNMRCQGLQREINMLKQRCSSFRSLSHSSS